VVIEGRWRYRLRSVSFGLTPSHKDYIFEEIFACVYHGHLSLQDAYNLPVHRRRWWIERIKEIHNQQQEDAEKTKEAQQQAVKSYQRQQQRQALKQQRA